MTTDQISEALAATGDMMKIEHEGEKFILKLDNEGNPYVLKRYRLSESGARWYYATVWASWHKGLPTGLRQRAIEAAGFVWDRSSNPCHWRRREERQVTTPGAR